MAFEEHTAGEKAHSLISEVQDRSNRNKTVNKIHNTYIAKTKEIPTANPEGVVVVPSSSSLE